MATSQEQATSILPWLVEHFVATGEDATVAEIAAGCHRSESWVRRQLQKGSVIDNTVQVKHSVPARSRDYPGFILRSVQVWKYGPSRHLLRRRLRER